MARKKKIGLLGASSYVVGCMIGSGIFITPTAVLQHTGSVGLSIVIWVAAGLLSLLGGFTYTELGTSIRLSGADFAYICYVGWEPIAFLFLWSSAVIYEPCELAIMAKTFAVYVFDAIPSKDMSPQTAESVQQLIGFLLLYLLIFVNMYRLDWFATWTQIITTIAKIASLGVIIVIGMVWWGQGKGYDFSNSFENSSTNVGSVVLGVYSGLWSYAGWETLNFGMEEIANPQRNVPISVLLGTVVMIIIYVFTILSYLVVLGKDGMLATSAVAESFAAKTWVGLQYAMPWLVGITIAGSFNADIFSASRVYFTGARGGQLPSFLGLLHVYHTTPQPALIFMALCASLAMQIESIETLINAVMFLQWMQRATATAALIYIRVKKIPVHKDAVKFPLVLHVLFFCLSVALVVLPIYDNWVLSLAGFAVLVVGAAVYAASLHMPAKLVQLDHGMTELCQKTLLCVTDYESLAAAIADEDGEGDTADSAPCTAYGTFDSRRPSGVAEEEPAQAVYSITK